MLGLMLQKVEDERRTLTVTHLFEKNKKMDNNSKTFILNSFKKCFLPLGSFGAIPCHSS